jgi:L-lactate dehydrogenase complex protein LldG
MTPAMSERDNILARIRKALATPAPRPGAHDGRSQTPPGLPGAADHRRVLPAVGESFEARLALFQQNAAELKAEFRLVSGLEALATELRKLREAEGWRKVASHRGKLTDAACGVLGLPVCRTDAPYDAHDLESCDAGLSECDALVAQTGSVLVTSRSCGGRGLSVLPPHHVVLATRDQLIAGLPEAFALIKSRYGANYPSMISFITGPSRTGDIERILVLGAHGPKKLTILCLE